MLKRTLSIILLIAPACFGQTQYSNVYGLVTNQAGSTSTVSTSVWLDNMWYVRSGGTLTEYYAYVTAVASTPTSANTKVEVYSDSSGVPGSLVAAGCSSTADTTPAAGWLKFSSFSSCTLSSNTQYHVLLKQASGAGTVTYRFMTGLLPGAFTGRNNGYSVLTSTSCDTTCSWSVQASGVVGTWRATMSGPLYRGFPYESTIGVAALATTERVQGSQEYGFSFTAPPNVSMNVAGVACNAGRNLSPTGNLSGSLYSGNSGTLTTVDTTNSYTSSQINTGFGWTAFWFSGGTHALTPGTVYRFSLKDSAADTGTTYYGIAALQITNDSTIRSLLPISGTYVGTKCSGSCTSAANWSESFNLPTCGLILDVAGEFASTGGGGSGGVRGYVGQ